MWYYFLFILFLSLIFISFSSNTRKYNFATLIHCIVASNGEGIDYFKLYGGGQRYSGTPNISVP